jgi:hypothetical protein
MRRSAPIVTGSLATAVTFESTRSRHGLRGIDADSVVAASAGSHRLAGFNRRYQRLPSVTREPVTLVHRVRDSCPRCPSGRVEPQGGKVVVGSRRDNVSQLGDVTSARLAGWTGRTRCVAQGISRASSPRPRPARGWHLVAHIAKASQARVHARQRHSCGLTCEVPAVRHELRDDLASLRRGGRTTIERVAPRPAPHPTPSAARRRFIER